MVFKHSIKAKFIVCILVMSIAPMMTLFIFSFVSSFSFYKRQLLVVSKAYLERELVVLNGIFDKIIGGMDTLTYNQNVTDNDVQVICKSELSDTPVTPYQRLLYTRDIIKYGEVLSYNNDYVEALYLYIPNRYVYSYTKSSKIDLSMDDLADEYRHVQQSRNTYLSVKIIDSNVPGSPGKFIVISRNVIDPVTRKSLGMLSIICDSAMCEQVTESTFPWGKINIIDLNGNVLFGSRNVTLDEDILQKINDNFKGIRAINVTHQDTILCGSLILGDWKLVCKVSMSSFNWMYMRNVTFLIWITVFCIIAALMMFILLDRIFTKPIVALSNSLKKGPSSIFIESKYLQRNDEIGVLYKGFMEMLNRINALIQEQYVNEIALLKSRMSNLMAQINSHFVFNTLENINCIAELDGIESISIMSKALGDMLRYSMDYDEDVVPLSSEISHITKYIEIQEIRFGKKIDLLIDVEERFLQHNVLKFMLQPIVENAVEHGFLFKDAAWQLVISACEFEGCMRITVRDNGIGIKPDKLNEIKGYLKTGEKGQMGNNYHHKIGLINIDKRIKLLYGPEFGLDIESNFGDGTSVYINLPL